LNKRFAERGSTNHFRTRLINTKHVMENQTLKNNAAQAALSVLDLQEATELGRLKK
jgi:hypothetical protein